ncbi:Histidine triad (HIT) protein [Legionella lansingensis]|uniref:Histidine triad (HIT) protein n=1 Tax=Legionella lansingensis TaxID=45067 RepID=A0A0W0VJZ9_9GAMM|nr:HIT family protein [Legionella lansingensis]KTD20420.1 Histidine triad (HIT) protein [Legionella lansingensis]SNV50035.1 Histidine triad (HIT) protein [Legionella lansingensis]
MQNQKKCVIDLIVTKEEQAYIIFEDEKFIAFLDHRPLFPGHTLLAPKRHFKTLTDLPDQMIQPFFLLIKKMTKAVTEAMGASGSFVAMNNVISQSYPSPPCTCRT